MRFPPVPQINQEMYVLKDQLDKELITQSQYTKRVNELKRAQLMFVAQSKGGYTAPKQRKRNTLTEIKDLHAARLIDEALAEPAPSE